MGPEFYLKRDLQDGYCLPNSTLRKERNRI